MVKTPGKIDTEKSLKDARRSVGRTIPVKVTTSGEPKFESWSERVHFMFLHSTMINEALPVFE